MDLSWVLPGRFCPNQERAAISHGIIVFACCFGLGGGVRVQVVSVLLAEQQIK